MKAIETKYNGYRFRSRLEAKWAVFFDAAGIKYEYEPEGYDLGEAGWYLPDFWLPELKIFVEIKGKSLSRSEELKIEELSKYNPVLVLKQIPSPDDPCACYYDDSDNESGSMYSHGGFGDRPYLFCTCPVCGKIGIEFDGRGARVDDCCPNSDKGYTYDDPRFINAYAKARQARFEYGEHP